jgi:signal transduction histidine kinase
VLFRYTRERLAIEVTNGVPPGPPAGADDDAGAGPGYGLIGMRERAASAGGTIDVRLAAVDLFTVRVDLPAPRRQQEEDRL